MRKLSGLIIIFVLCILLTSTVMAADMLNLKNVRIEVDDDKQSANEGGGSIDITPDSELVMKVEVENLFESGVDGGEIEDIQVTATLEDIDDGDDIEEEADEFDLRPGRDKTVTITFDIPLRLETDETFILTLEVEGEDKNGTIHTLNVEYDVDVDKENHEIRFLNYELRPDRVSCTDSTTVSLELINTGEDDEDDVELTVTSTDLGYNEREVFDMSGDIDDDENEYEFVDTIDVSEVSPGTYSVKVHVSYNNARESLDVAMPLTIEKCGTDEPEPTPAPKPAPAPAPTQTQTTTTTTPTTTAPAPTTTSDVQVVSAPQTSYVRPSQLVATPKTNYNNSWWDNNKWLAIILITDLVLVIAGIIVIMMVLKRRRH